MMIKSTLLERKGKDVLWVLSEEFEVLKMWSVCIYEHKPNLKRGEGVSGAWEYVGQNSLFLDVCKIIALVICGVNVRYHIY